MKCYKYFYLEAIEIVIIIIVLVSFFARTTLINKIIFIVTIAPLWIMYAEPKIKYCIRGRKTLKEYLYSLNNKMLEILDILKDILNKIENNEIIKNSINVNIDEWRLFMLILNYSFLESYDRKIYTDLIELFSNTNIVLNNIRHMNILLFSIDTSFRYRILRKTTIDLINSVSEIIDKINNIINSI